MYLNFQQEHKNVWEKMKFSSLQKIYISLHTCNNPIQNNENCDPCIFDTENLFVQMRIETRIL